MELLSTAANLKRVPTNEQRGASNGAEQQQRRSQISSFARPNRWRGDQSSPALCGVNRWAIASNQRRVEFPADSQQGAFAHQC